MQLQPKSAKATASESSSKAEDEPKKPTVPVVDYFDDFWWLPSPKKTRFLNRLCWASQDIFFWAPVMCLINLRNAASPPPSFCDEPLLMSYFFLNEDATQKMVADQVSMNF